MEAVIEAILFTMGESVELKKIAAAIEHDEATTRKIIHRLQDKYEAEDRGLRIIELEDSFQLCTKREMYDYLIRIAKQPKKCVLTDVLLETLSIIAYRQPVTKLEIEKIRGVKSDHAVNKLVKKRGVHIGILPRAMFSSASTVCVRSRWVVSSSTASSACFRGAAERRLSCRSR